MIQIGMAELAQARGWYTELSAAVSRQRRVYAETYLRADDRLRAVISESLLRQLIEDQGAADFGSVEIAHPDRGKPNLLYPNGWTFSTSHSGDWVAVALAPVQVGIDVERVADGILDLDSPLFTELGHAGNSAHARTGLWTVKEAVLKCTGSESLERIYDVRVNMQGDGRCIANFDGERFVVYRFQLLGDHCMALSVNEADMVALTGLSMKRFDPRVSPGSRPGRLVGSLPPTPDRKLSAGNLLTVPSGNYKLAASGGVGELARKRDGSTGEQNVRIRCP